MRKVIAAEFVTLDGLMSDVGDTMEWTLTSFNDEMARAIADQQAATDTILMGRVTYDIMAGYWPTEHAAEEDPGLVNHMNETPKVIFSRTLEQANWNNTTVVRDDIEGEVRRLKVLPGKNIALLGSASIVAQLANAGLIDEYQLLLNPVVLGRGKPLFGDTVSQQDLKLVKAETFTNGVLALTYQPVGH
ncbi:MAG: dihydrofolate reductase [Chloroflexia bacterium]|nr:dihydrofolate reductase [Chloroflexia bacterium]